MAGETIKTEAICLGISPWSRTSHVTSWLTPGGRIVTVVRGAVRPKSAFLGQYDLNYTCEIVYYARARGELHALRECSPSDRRDYLREDYRALVLAEHCRHLAARFVPDGPEAAGWYDLLTGTLDSLRGASAAERLLPTLLEFEKRALQLAGVWPEIPPEGGELRLVGDRGIPLAAATAACLRDLPNVTDAKILLDAARVISVLYATSLESVSESRRSVLRLIGKSEEGKASK